MTRESHGFDLRFHGNPHRAQGCIENLPIRSHEADPAINAKRHLNSFGTWPGKQPCGLLQGTPSPLSAWPHHCRAGNTWEEGSGSHLGTRGRLVLCPKDPFVPAGRGNISFRELQTHTPPQKSKPFCARQDTPVLHILFVWGCWEKDLVGLAPALEPSS